MIVCPICGGRTSVVETRATGTGTRRRRSCVDLTCSGKVTTVEVIVPEGRAAALTRGNVMVPTRQIEQLRKIVAEIGGGS